jgi:hypothetical protein
LMAAGCGSASTTAGTITGVASPCIGVVGPTQYASIPVTVTLRHGSKTVGRQTVRGRHIYRFTAAPGSYLVSTPSDEGDGSLPQHVTVHSGQVATANIPSMCR